MHEEWTDRFSAYLDDELLPADRAAIERHLADCAPCHAVMQELREVTAWAPGYQGAPLANDAWPGIAAAIDQARLASISPRRERRFSLGQMAAAAAVMAVVSGSAVWMALRPDPTGSAVAPVAAEVAVTNASLVVDPAWESAVSELEQILHEGRGQLDTATVRIIETNLAVIDAAIAEARAAILADPSNVHLAPRIRTNMQRKLVLLRQAARAAGAAS